MTRGANKNAANAAAANTGEGSEEDGGSLHEMMKTMSKQLSSMNKKLESIETIESEVRGLKVLLNDLKQENKELKAEARATERKLQEMNEKNNLLENRLNNLEQHHRGWSARVLNIPLSKDEETNNTKVRDKVYNLLLLPILRGAMEKKLIQSIPTAEQLLEVAHILPGPAGPKPIIMRFYNRNVRDMCFQLKKHYAPRAERGGAGGGGGSAGGRGGAAGGAGGGAGAEDAGGFEGRGRYLYPLYEDLTKVAFQKMRGIAKDSRVKACWSVKGQIKFILNSKPQEVKRVESLLDSLDSILK